MPTRSAELPSLAKLQARPVQLVQPDPEPEPMQSEPDPEPEPM